jgi:hypothetical protein
MYGIGSPVNVQDIFSSYLNHNASQSIIQPYLNSTVVAQAAGKPFLMFETNTASCGGFPGLSDSFGAAMWALDYGLQMAYSNFSGAMLHVSGQDVYYNVCAYICYSLLNILNRCYPRSPLRVSVVILPSCCGIVDVQTFVFSPPNKREYVPPVDRRTPVLRSSGCCGDAWDLWNVPDNGPPSKCRKHIYSRICDL